MAEQFCQQCDGMGMRVTADVDGKRVAGPCECQHRRRSYQLQRRARIPQRYESCTLDGYRYGLGPDSDASLWSAFNTARGFVKSYPATTNGNGILLTGDIGTGKTHLAVAILQALVVKKGVSGLFCDCRELLKSIANTYNSKVAETELEVLQPILAAEVLVIDELGAAKPTEWAGDTIAHVINTRYNDRRTTIITTNYANRAPGVGSQTKVQAFSAVKRTLEESLGDRIGESMRSRLSEMCVTVELRGSDYRQRAERAQSA